MTRLATLRQYAIRLQRVINDSGLDYYTTEYFWQFLAARKVDEAEKHLALLYKNVLCDLFLYGTPEDFTPARVAHDRLLDLIIDGTYKISGLDIDDLKKRFPLEDL